MRHGSKLPLTNRPPQNPTRESAHKLKLGSEYAAFIETPESWFQFEIAAKEANQTWVVRAQLPIGQQGHEGLARGVFELAELKLLVALGQQTDGTPEGIAQTL